MRPLSELKESFVMGAAPGKVSGARGGAVTPVDANANLFKQGAAKRRPRIDIADVWGFEDEGSSAAASRVHDDALSSHVQSFGGKPSNKKNGGLVDYARGPSAVGGAPAPMQPPLG